MPDTAAAERRRPGALATGRRDARDTHAAGALFPAFLAPPAAPDDGEVGDRDELRAIVAALRVE
ncbi:hypothetical protein [Pseudonocardia sp. T1-2H]|uniref:hypothetical protein n=1 Tax=Pseudonocardia sp. T1-2H TaxID=3128899 RepID=UPI0031011343